MHSETDQNSVLGISENLHDHSDHDSLIDDDFGSDYQFFGADDDPVYCRPIVVGYSFGPKKMSTMGVVMAEASKTLLLRTNQKQLNRTNSSSSSLSAGEGNHDNEESPDVLKSINKPLHQHEGSELNASSSTFPDSEESLKVQKSPLASLPASSSHRSRQSRKQRPATVVFTWDRYTNSSADGYSATTPSLSLGGLRSVVRTLGESSLGDDSSTHSTGTRTASTTTTHASFRTGSFPSSSTYDTALRAPSTAVPIRVSFVPLDPEIPLEEQHGGVDVILHKLTEDILLLSQLSLKHKQLKTILQVEDGVEAILAGMALSDKEVAAIRRVYRLCQFQREHGCYLVDNPICVQTLMSRAEIAHVLKRALSGVTTCTGLSLRAPKYAVVDEISEDPDSATTIHERIENAITQAGLNFPIIVKPLTAAGTKASHSMAVVMNRSGLVQISDRVPCLLQEYVDHDAMLYKVYVLGDFVSVHKRRSLPNLNGLSSTTDVVQFDSQRPYPRIGDFGLSKNPSVEAVDVTNHSANDAHTKVDPLKTHNISSEAVRPIAQNLKEAFGLEIFGFDVLITSDKTNMLVVDVNYFPSYKEVPNFPSLLAKYLTTKAIAKRIEGNDTET